MHRNIRLNRAITLLLTIITLFSITSAAFAADSSNDSDNSTIQITTAPNRQPTQDLRCDLYYIADLTGNLATELQPYHIKLDVNNLHEAAILASTLESIVLKDRVMPTHSGFTDKFGTLICGDLKPGLYLLLTQNFETNTANYIAQPSLFILNQRVSINIRTKYAIQPKPQEPEDPPTTMLKVLKKWDDSNDSNRPESINVTLMRNGREIETVTLSSKNNWRFTWDDLNAYAHWSVIENFSNDNENYEVSIEKSGITVILTNHKAPDEPERPPVVPPDNKPGEKPNLPQNPPQDTTEIPPVNIPKDPGPEFPNEPKLPQTGTTWYLVPILVAAGILLLIVSLLVNHRAKHSSKLISTIILIASVLVIFAAGVLIGLNQKDEDFAEKTTAMLQYNTNEHIQSVRQYYSGQDVTPDYLLDEARDMPVQAVDGLDVIAQLTIPDLDIDLPILSKWNTADAKSAPCRCSGTAYDKNLIIAGHSYKAHFRALYNATENMQAILTDMDGNEFRYNITGTETIDEYDRQALAGNGQTDWDMTLFTCTPDSRRRFLVRCSLQDPPGAGR